MRMMKLFSAAAAAGVLALGAATAANATIIDIDATTTGVDLTLAPGEYLIQWAGIAGGGAFDGYHADCPTGDCTSGWSDAFAATDVPFDPNGEIDFFNLSPGFSSASAALSAVQSAPAISHGTLDLAGGFPVPGSFTLLAPIPQPWKVIISGGTTHLFTPDGDGNLANNFGGVSLRITAVPEPATWGLMLLGFGGLGAMLRKRRKPAGALA